MSDPAPSQTSPPAASRRPSRLWRALGCLGVLSLLPIAVAGWWVAWRLAFHEQQPILDEDVEAWAEELAGEPEDGATPTIDVSGSGDLNFDHFAIHDRRGHRVLSVDELRGNLDLAALREGVFRLQRGRATGVELNLHRGPSGRVSLAEIFRPPTGGEGEEIAEEQGEQDDESPDAQSKMRLEIGPVVLRDVLVNVEMGERPVRIVFDRARMSMQTRPEGGHRIRIWDVQGRVLEPDVFPLPVRIVDANGSIRLGYGNLVDLRARTCIGRGEIRSRIVLPARRQPIDMTVDARGMLGVMGRVGIFVAAARQPERFRATAGVVEMTEGISCTRLDAMLVREDQLEEGDDAERAARTRRAERRSARIAGMGADAAAESASSLMRVRRRDDRRDQRVGRREQRRREKARDP